ncbi:MAG: hypothetical protein WCV69_03855 [Patescibacteria group bacterium]|jgi:hypothetical protein
MSKIILPRINTPGLAVDIDETLSFTIGHLVNKLQENFGNPENLSVKEIIEKYRYTQNVPYWQHAEAQKWIDKEIHSNELQENLPLIEDADIYLKKINEIIPIVAYITVRPQSVTAGTEIWLKKHKFPLAPIIARPLNVPHTTGNAWKAKILNELYPSVQGIIDDNAKLLEFLGENYKGIIFLYDHHATDSKLNVVPCPNWLKVFEEVKKYSPKK